MLAVSTVDVQISQFDRKFWEAYAPAHKQDRLICVMSWRLCIQPKALYMVHLSPGVVLLFTCVLCSAGSSSVIWRHILGLCGRGKVSGGVEKVFSTERNREVDEKLLGCEKLRSRVCARNAAVKHFPSTPKSPVWITLLVLRQRVYISSFPSSGHWELSVWPARISRCSGHARLQRVYF